MTIIVEDGTIVDNANSFVSLTDAQSFVDLRGFECYADRRNASSGDGYFAAYAVFG